MQTTADERILSVSDALSGHGPKLWWLVGFTLVTDVALTLYGMSLNLVEMNPLAAFAIAEYGLAGMVGLKTLALAVAVAGWAVLPVTYARFVPLLVALPWGVASTVNAVLVAVVLT